MKYIVRRTLLAAAIATAFFAGMLNAHGADAAKPHHKAPQWTKMLPTTMRHACAYEDSVNCYWDAGSAGNHKGHSFIVREFPGKANMICVMYIAKADAKKWDYCEAMASHS